MGSVPVGGVLSWRAMGCEVGIWSKWEEFEEACERGTVEVKTVRK